MRIAMIGPFALHPKGTVPLRMIPLAKALSKKGNDVVIVLPPYDNLKHSGRSFRVQGINICNVTIPKTFLPLKYCLVAEELVRKVAEFHPDVIHVFKPKGYSGLAGMFISVLNFMRIMDVPVVVDSDDLEGWSGFANFFLEHKIYPKFMLDFFDFQEKWLLHHASAVTVASKFLEAIARQYRKDADCSTISYIPNGPTNLPSQSCINLKDLANDLNLAGCKVILLYTRFYEYDVEEVVDILSHVVSRMHDVKLLVVGKGEFEEEKNLLGMASQKGISKYVAYAGWIKPEEILSYIRIADVAIYPFEDTPLNRAKCPGKLVQLMISGKAIVADRVGQIAEYIEDEKSGILVKPGDTKEFARRVVELLGNRSLCEMFGKKAKKRIFGVFSWKFSVEKVQKMYNMVCSSDIARELTSVRRQNNLSGDDFR